MTDAGQTKDGKTQANDPWSMMMSDIDSPAPLGVDELILDDEEIDRLMGLSSEGDDKTGKTAVAEAAAVSSGLSPAMRLISETFVDGLPRNIRQGVAGLIDVSLQELSLIRLSNGIGNFPLPSLIAVLTSKALGGSGLVVADSALGTAFFDLMMGGGQVGASYHKTARPYSVVEMKLYRQLADFVARAFADAFADIFKADFFIDRIETNPHFIQIGKPADHAVRLKVQLLFGKRGGSLDLILPLGMFGAYGALIRSQEEEVPAVGEAAWRQHLVQTVGESAICLEAVLAEFRLPLRAVLNLSVGQTIPLNIDPSAPIWMKNAGNKIGRGLMGRSHDHMALRIVQPISARFNKDTQ